MLYTYQCLPEQKPNSKQEKTIYGKKKTKQKNHTFEKCDGKNILCWLNILGFHDSRMPYDFHALVLFYLTELELIKLNSSDTGEQ